MSSLAGRDPRWTESHGVVGALRQKRDSGWLQRIKNRLRVSKLAESEVMARTRQSEVLPREPAGRLVRKESRHGMLGSVDFSRVISPLRADESRFCYDDESAIVRLEVCISSDAMPNLRPGRRCSRRTKCLQAITSE